jgi:hypothetical protein
MDGADSRGVDAVADVHQLRILITNERDDRLELLAQILAELGHEATRSYSCRA